jgi:hypothetical protein
MEGKQNINGNSFSGMGICEGKRKQGIKNGRRQQ